MFKTALALVAASLASVLVVSTVRADDADLGELAMKVMEHVASDVDGNKPDCDKIGTALAAHMDADADTMAKIKASDAKKTKAQKAGDKKAMQAKYGDRMKAVQTKMAPIKSCKKNDKVVAYMKKVMS